MPPSRRTTLAALALLPLTTAHATPTTKTKNSPMYGLIGKMRAHPGQRDALITILLEGTVAMPGCLSYIIAKDNTDADAIWITETWETAAHHKASLALASVQAAITKARPLIAGFADRFETEPIGGHSPLCQYSLRHLPD